MTEERYRQLLNSFDGQKAEQMAQANGFTISYHKEKICLCVDKDIEMMVSFESFPELTGWICGIHFGIQDFEICDGKPSLRKDRKEKYREFAESIGPIYRDKA